jgi:hypothetical protein
MNGRMASHTHKLGRRSMRTSAAVALAAGVIAAKQQQILRV